MCNRKAPPVGPLSDEKNIFICLLKKISRVIFSYLKKCKVLEASNNIITFFLLDFM